MAMEPTSEEQKGMKTVQDVWTWAGTSGDFAAGLVEALGTQPGDAARVTAAIESSDEEEVKVNLKLGDAKLSPAQEGSWIWPG